MPATATARWQYSASSNDFAGPARNTEVISREEADGKELNHRHLVGGHLAQWGRRNAALPMHDDWGNRASGQ